MSPASKPTKKPPFGYIDPSAGRTQGYYGWAGWRERIPARWLLARKSGHGRLSALVGLLRGELRSGDVESVVCLKCGLPESHWSESRCPGGHFWIDDPLAIAPQHRKKLLG